MNIARLQATAVRLPYDPPFESGARPGVIEHHRDVTLVKLTTDDGVVGWGGTPGDSAALINAAVAPAIVGQDLHATERHASLLRQAGGRAWAVDIAIWDAIGKAACQPLYKLWGGYTDRVRAYASTIQFKQPEERPGDALARLAEGFRAIKLRCHYDTIDDDIRLVELVRAAVEDNMDIMVDANQAGSKETSHRGPVWDYRRAKRTAEALDELDVVWLEEPLCRFDFAGLARLSAEVDIPIAGGEGNRGLHEFKWMVDQKVFGILQPDCVTSEGIFQLHKIAALAELNNLLFVPHHGMGALAFAAHLHLSCAVPNSPWTEYMHDPPYRNIEHFIGMGGIVTNPPRIDADGYVPAPRGPGLGMDVDEAAIDRWKK